MVETCDIGDGGSSALLSQADPPPFTVVNEGADAHVLIVCDHAGRRTPARLGGLGAPDHAFDRHIALDIGAAEVARGLAKRLGATAVLQTYSRLVIDCNRRLEDPASIVSESDGVRIRGNEDLGKAERQARIDEIFRPYHAAIDGELIRLRRRRPPVLVSIHSFTPEMDGARRPWTYGVLHDGRSPVSSAMLELLSRAELGPVGDNQPYAFDGTDFTVPHHACDAGLDYLELEIRQDLICDEEGQARAAALLAALIARAMQSGA